MSTYVLMRILESAPRRYDRGIRVLTLGRIGAAYDRLASRIRAGDRVLDLGCGTGALALRAAARGARVKAVDVSPEMLEIAGRRVREAGLEDRVELRERGVAELDSEPDGAYDAVTCGLVLSELSEDEIRFTLREVRRLLKPGGLLLLADELRPASVPLRILHALLKAPLAALAYALTQQTTHAVGGLRGRLEQAGLPPVEWRANRLGSFGEIVARKPPVSGGADGSPAS
ncbi:MAG: corrinoid protein-associated methyltransferase CpaM [Gemmatimonadota bacterium]